MLRLLCNERFNNHLLVGEPLGEKDVYASYLPLAHMFERVLYFVPMSIRTSQASLFCV